MMSSPLFEYDIISDFHYVRENDKISVFVISSGQVTITHQMLAPIIGVLCVIIVPGSDKRWWEALGKMFLAY